MPLFALSVCQDNSFTIHGEAAFAHGVLIPDAEVMLLDTTEKLIQRTRTSKKILKKYGGGKFKFSNVPPGEYIISISFGSRLDIKNRVTIKSGDIDLGTIYNRISFPKHEITEYPVDNIKYMQRIQTEPSPGDSINIRHVILKYNGEANTVLVDSIVQDFVFYTDYKTLQKGSSSLDNIYTIYNDYGIIIFQSRSMKDRIKDLQHRDGYIIFKDGDTLYFDHIVFEPVIKDPKVATFHNADTTGRAKYHSIFDLYKVHSGPSYVGKSVEKGFWLGVQTIGWLVTFQAIVTTSFTPFMSLFPDVSPPIKGSYGTVITVLPLFPLGRVAYDLYKDKRANYFFSKFQDNLFPQDMFVFSFREWIGEKSQPIIQPIVNSKPVKWWQNKKLKKSKRQAAKRKSVSG